MVPRSVCRHQDHKLIHGKSAKTAASVQPFSETMAFQSSRPFSDQSQQSAGPGDVLWDNLSWTASLHDRSWQSRWWHLSCHARMSIKRRSFTQAYSDGGPATPSQISRTPASLLSILSIPPRLLVGAPCVKGKSARPRPSWRAGRLRNTVIFVGMM